MGHYLTAANTVPKVVPTVTATSSWWVTPSESKYSTPMPVEVWFGSKQGLGPNVSDTSKKFLLELSAATVPENEQPELEPLTLPLELIVTVVVVPSNKVPVQVPVIAERDAEVL